MFDALVEAKLTASGKARSEFLIALKPNFMCAYDRRDHSTYTDPELVHHLVARLRRNGFARIKVVEAQSTYGECFLHRSVREVAEYLGYDGSAGYEAVDLTLDRAESRDLGAHLGVHPVPVTWRDADLRVSFAKNKTHAYAFYTLTLKNIYGSLALANKFRSTTAIAGSTRRPSTTSGPSRWITASSTRGSARTGRSASSPTRRRTRRGPSSVAPTSWRWTGWPRRGWVSIRW